MYMGQNYSMLLLQNRLIWRDDIRMDLDEGGKIESVALRKVKHLGGTLCSSLDFNFPIQVSSYTCCLIL